MKILTEGMKTLRQRCVKGLKIDKKRTQELFENSLCTATALVPHIGYAQTAEVVKAALKNNRTIKEEILSRKLLTEKKLSEII